MPAPNEHADLDKMQKELDAAKMEAAKMRTEMERLQVEVDQLQKRSNKQTDKIEETLRDLKKTDHGDKQQGNND